MEKVVSVCATLIRESGSGLDKIFHDLPGHRVRSTAGAAASNATRVAGVRRYPRRAHSGGLRLLYGTDGGIPTPRGSTSETPSSALSTGNWPVSLPPTMSSTEPSHRPFPPWSMSPPVLCTRDFNLIPAMLRQKFKLPVEKMDFPLWSRRTELSDPTRRTVPASRR